MEKPKLRTGFDARMVAYRQAGIGQYCLNLLRELAALQAGRSDFSLTVYQSRKEPARPEEWLGLAGRPPLNKRALWTPPHHRFEQLALPLELLPGGPQVFHSPDFIPPFRRLAVRGPRLQPVASVITIHDLAFRHFPHLLTEESARYYGQVKRAAESAELVIAVSESTARDIRENLGTAPQKIRVIYEAASPLYRPLDPAELAGLENGPAATVAAKLRAGGIAANETFWLFVSTIEPRKNLPVLLKAYRAFLDSLPPGNERPKLALAGREGWLFQDIYREAGELNLAQALVWLGPVETEELLYLYNRAAGLLMPSLYEGFGLPPLEALACGCPALVADTSSLPEVVGAAGTKIAPQDVAAWSAALLAHWQRRAEVKARALAEGPAWAGQFSWRRAAEETLAVYFEAATLVKNVEKRK